MEIKPLRLKGTYEIILDPKRDERGYFARVYDEAIFAEYGLTTSWVQENQSLTKRMGTIRGLHFQRPPYAETKLVRVADGEVYDVFIDLRKESHTFGHWDSVYLSSDKLNMVYIPKGFAHGFCSLSDETLVTYKVDAVYSPDYEGGIRWNDGSLKIPWPATSPLISEKDIMLPLFDEFTPPF